MGKLREMCTYWSHAFLTRPIRATFEVVKWLGLVALGMLGVASLVYILAGRGYEEPPAESTRRDQVLAERYGHLSTFMTEAERRRAYENDEQAERELLLGVALQRSPRMTRGCSAEMTRAEAAQG
jgi:hypothetical protein